MGEPARLKVVDGVPMVRYADGTGKMFDFYNLTAGAPVVLPGWAVYRVPPQQVQHFLDMGLLEFCDADGNPTDPGRVWECASALVAVDCRPDSGAERARQALRSNGFAFSNETIAKAVAVRKAGLKYGQDSVDA
ncbi:Uncharacterised protein [Mycobacteroides abscessus subsp. abscessus]|uniref:hypothetical protein n=1 Tax=Mycobacteroides abscessus TaxID=36809 RepID=UPI00092CBF2D|nr:hypothetical protein [Mycobacteroides abscessus]SIE28470.1 Uncharacterised protein [Mycobacteroides abscessus subsp. abscessus]SKV14598.1 Uncharacterised protein [Mycobacteroides abscessus subsp. abscessus]